MFQPSTSRDPLLTRGGDSGSHGGESVEEHAFDDDCRVWKTGDFTDVNEDQTLTPISESTIVEGVDAKVLKLPGEDQRFIFVEFSPDWKTVVTVTSDGTFFVWDAKDEWVLVGSKRLHRDVRSLKCIAFDPYIEEAVLLCFNSGELFRTNLRGPSTEDVPTSSQVQGMFDTELVYKCQGRVESRYGHFTFSSDRKMMVYYNLDGEFVAIQFEKQGSPKSKTLSKDFVVKQKPNIYVSKQNVLVTAIMKSSEDSKPIKADIETLLWSELDFDDIESERKHASFRGKGYLSNDGSYVVTSTLNPSKHSTRCKIELYRITDVEFNTAEKGNRLATRWLNYQSNHPEMECLDADMFNCTNAKRENREPLIAMKQTNATGSRIVFWDIDSNAIVFEIDLTLNKGVQNFSEVKYCFSSDCKWIGVYCADAKMVGLICARSGVFVWTAYIPHAYGADIEFCALSFDTMGTRLMIHLGEMIFLFEPPCLSKKPPKHPMHQNTILTQTTRTYTDFEILEKAKEWPKHVLFNALRTSQGVEEEVRILLVDVAVSLCSESLALICQKHKGNCFLLILKYSEMLSREWLWFSILLQWNQCFLNNNIFSIVKELEGEQELKCTSVFYYPHEETNTEQIVLFSSKGGIKMQVLDSNLNQLSGWKMLLEQTCFSFTQSSDRRHVISLADRLVLIVDLNEKKIVKNVEYSVGLNQWWESFVDGIKFFEYSHYHSLADQDCDKEHELFSQERIRGHFDVSDDGEMILIGWNSKQNRSLILTPDKSEEQFRLDWDEARKSLYWCSMLTSDGQWIGFIDYERLKDGDIVVCVINTSDNRQTRVYLGSSEALVKPSSQRQSPRTIFFFHLKKIEQKLTVLGLEDIGAGSTLKEFSIGIADDEPVHRRMSLLENIVQPTNLDKYGKKNQPSTFNMIVANTSNFQRVLVEEGEAMMVEIAKYAIDNKVKVSNVYRFHNEKEHDSTTFLAHAIETKDASMVKLCLQFIEYDLFPFNSAATMVKDSFFELLFSYTELFLPILEKRSFTVQVAEVSVPGHVFHSQKKALNLVFTSDTILDWDEHFGANLDEDFWESHNIVQPARSEDYQEGMNVLSSVSFHCIANACKVGLNGIMRKLLMQDVPHSVFKTQLIQATITWKWEKLWKQQCLKEVCLYSMFLFLFTSYAICIGLFGEKLKHDKWVKLGVSIPLLGVVILATLYLFNEYMQLRTYVKDGKEVFETYVWGLKHYLHSQWNLVELTSYFFVLIIIPVFHCSYILKGVSKTALFIAIAIESILAWFKVWYYAQPFDKTGALVLLISNVVYDCLPFLFLAVAILVGFSIALYVLFHIHPFKKDLHKCSYSCRSFCNNIFFAICERDFDYCYSFLWPRHDLCYQACSHELSIKIDEINEILETPDDSFGSSLRSLATMFYAVVGEFDPDVYYNHQRLPWLTTFLFIIYMALEMIVMLNMLIAVMGDTFDRVKNEEDVQITIGRAQFMDAFEASLSTSQIHAVEKKIGKFLYIMTPKEGEHNVESKNWKGKINLIEDNVKKVVKVLKNNVTSGFVDNKKAIEDYKEEMENIMQERFNQIKIVLQTTLQEHKRILDERNKQEEEHRRKEEEHWKNNREFLLSIAERIDVLEADVCRLTSSNDQ